METSRLLLFGATVLPLVCTPGPDLLFIAGQALTGGQRGALRANAGVICGYLAHAALAATGVAALVAASPLLFDLLRGAGIAYLLFLALQLGRSATRPAAAGGVEPAAPASLAKGFLTSFLNPKGLLVYFALLPNFMDPAAPAGPQAAALSAVFVALCALVYAIVGAGVAALGARGAASDRLRRCGEGMAGAMLLFAAVRMASH